MRTKKILSLAVVLAMVLTVMPMFGLTASAEATLVYDGTGQEIKGWGKSHAAVNFTPVVGEVTITFDVTYLQDVMNLDANPGDFFIGFGQGGYTGYGNVPSFGDSAIGLQPFGNKQDTFKIGFRNGSSAWKVAGDEAVADAEVNQTYSVTINTNTTAHTYTASIKKADGDQAEVLPTTDSLAYRYAGADTIDTFMIFRNGGTDAEEDYFKVANLKVTGTPADVYGREVDITEGDLTAKNGIPYQLVKEDGKAKNLIFNGDFSYGTSGWTNGTYGLLKTDWFPISDKGSTKALKDSHAESASDGSASASSIGSRWAIEGGKTYIFVIDMMKESSADNNGGLWFFDSVGTKLRPTADNCLSDSIKVTSNGDGLCETGDFRFNSFTANQWVTKKYLIKAPDTATTIQFCNAWSSDTWIDNAALYEVERIPTEVTVNFQDADTQGSVGTPEIVTGLYVGDSYTYDVTDANQIKTFDGKTYIYQSGTNTIDSLKKKSEGNTLTLTYKQDEPKTVTDLQLKTRPGFAAVLPETVDAQGQSATFKALAVTWDGANKEKKPEVSEIGTTYDITGHLTDYPSVSVKATVTVVAIKDYIIAYASFDDDNASKDVGSQRTVTKGDGKVETAEGYSGKAAVFEGKNKDNAAYIEVSGVGAADKALVGLDAFTVTFYAKTNVNANTTNWPFYAAPDDNSGDNYLAVIQNKDATTVGFERYIGDRNKADTSAASGNNYPIIPDTWTAYALVVDGAKTTLYVNGVEAASKTVTNPDSKMSDLFNATSKVKLGYANWGETFNGMIDEFKIYSVALTADEIKSDDIHTVTVEYYYDDGQTQLYKTESKNVLNNGSVSFDAVETSKDGKFYDAEAKTFDNVTEDKTEKVSLKLNPGKVGPTDAVTWNFTSKAAEWPNSEGFTASKKDGLQATSWEQRYAFVEFPVSVGENQHISSAKLQLVTGFTNANNKGYISVYAIDPSIIDGETVTADSFDVIKDYQVNASTAVGSKGDKITAVLDLSEYFEKYPGAESVALVIRSNAGNHVFNKDSTALEYETAYNDVAASAYLGRSENGDLAIDFEFGELYDGATVEITREDGQYTQKPEMSENSIVSITPANSNIIYTAAVKVGETVVGEVKASLYSVVVNNVTSQEVNYSLSNVNKAMVSKVNDVIANGGVAYSDDLTAEAKKIMTKENDTTIKILENAYKLGIGFTYNDGKLYVGSADKTVTEGESGKVYAVLTIAGDNVTLSGEIVDGTVTVADAVTLSLDSVNIEFVETLIEELEADGADSAVDFIPEL